MDDCCVKLVNLHKQEISDLSDITKMKPPIT